MFSRREEREYFLEFLFSIHLGFVHELSGLSRFFFSGTIIKFESQRLESGGRNTTLLEEEGVIRKVDEFLGTPEFEVRKDKVYDQVSSIILKTVKNAKYDFVRYADMEFKGVSREVADDILNILLEEKAVVKVGDDMCTLTEYMDQAKEMISEKLSVNPVITIAEVRDMFRTSRKSAKPILEYMDSIKVTKKTGAESERVKY